MNNGIKKKTPLLNFNFFFLKEKKKKKKKKEKALKHLNKLREWDLGHYG
jgi:hypothetical protein